MSRSEDNDGVMPPGAALDALATAVERSLQRVTRLRQRAESAESRRDEVEALLAKMADGTANPADMQTRLQMLEKENADLHRRIEEGRQGVDRLLAKIRFLEEQR